MRIPRYQESFIPPLRPWFWTRGRINIIRADVRTATEQAHPRSYCKLERNFKCTTTSRKSNAT